MHIEHVHSIWIGCSHFHGLQLSGNIFVRVGRPRRIPHFRLIKTYFMSAREHLIPWSDVADLAAYEFCGIVRIDAADAIPR